MQTHRLNTCIQSKKPWVPLCLAQVFCYTGEQAHEEMRSACFDYLRLGGMYSAGAPGDEECIA